jgi:DNA-binding NtrC family response regulator
MAAVRTAVERCLLVIAEGQLAYHSLPSSTIRIGSSSHCEVKIDHPSISPLHAVLQLGPRCMIEDRSALRNIRVRGQTLSPREPVEVAIGDVIEIGPVLIIVQNRAPDASIAVRRPASRGHGDFAACLDDACARALRGERRLAVVVGRASNIDDAHAVYELVAELAHDDACIGLTGTTDVELLVIDGAVDDIAELVDRMRAAAAARGVTARFASAEFPRDGRDARALLAAAGRALHDAAHGAADELRLPTGAVPPEPAVIECIAAGTISVLILGETGVGKEVLAERIHRASPRSGRPLIRLNCAALSATLLESELFGHEKGAFTGALTAKQGLIEAAEGGTVFLDEIGELPMAVQVKLLRVLESREILPVGGVKARAVDVRFVSATHVDLEAEIERGGFRADLYYRLNGVTFYVPPLRHRISEIAGLADAFIAQACRGLGRGGPPTLSREALRVLESYHWSGNIRELRNVIERAVLFCAGDAIRPDHLAIDSAGGLPRRPAEPARPPRSGKGRAGAAAATDDANGPTAAPVQPEPPAGEAMTIQRELEMLEKQRILQALETCAGNQSRAAKLLAIPRRTLLKRLDTYRIPRPRKRSATA